MDDSPKLEYQSAAATKLDRRQSPNTWTAGFITGLAVGGILAGIIGFAMAAAIFGKQ